MTRPQFQVSGVFRRLCRSGLVFGALAGVALAVFEGSDHHVHVLPADASPLGVLLGAAACAVGATLAGAGIQRGGIRRTRLRWLRK